MESAPSPQRRSTRQSLKRGATETVQELAEYSRSCDDDPTCNDIPTMSTGVPTISTEVPIISTGVPTMSTGVPTITPGVPTITPGVPTIITGLPPIITGVPTMSTGVPTMITGVPTISTGVPTIITGVPTISTGVPTISTGGRNLTYTAEKKRRKKRRSSFVNIVGRKSGDFLRPVNKLCESIPKDLPEEERLEKLTIGALDYALLNIQHENLSLDLGPLKTKVRDAGLVIIEDLKERGEFAKACQTRQKENPVNIQNRKIAEGYESRMETLKKEAHAWDKQLEKMRNLCTKAQKQLDEMTQHPIRLPPKTLSTEQYSLLNDVSLNRDQLEAEVTNVRERLITHVSKLESCVHGLHCKHRNVTAKLSRLTQQLHDVIKQEKTDPRESIVAFIEAWETMPDTTAVSDDVIT